MTVNPFVLLPDFSLILFGAWLGRVANFGAEFWRGAEKIVYYVFFPLLLFYSIGTAQLSFDSARLFVAAGVTGFAASIALAFIGGLLFKPSPQLFGSVVQTGFRFNAYIGLALSSSLFGQAGVALFALLCALCIPIGNVFAVFSLARNGKHQGENRLGRELLTNPLIIGTLSGVGANLLGITLWAPLATVIERMGNASLVLGLLCVGAGLTLRAAQMNPAVLAYCTVTKLIGVSLLMWAMSVLFGLRGLEFQVLMLFGALPTSASAYVLAVRMGGSGAPVAFLISLQTLLAMLTVPLWMTWAAR